MLERYDLKNGRCETVASWVAKRDRQARAAVRATLTSAATTNRCGGAAMWASLIAPLNLFRGLRAA